MDRAGAPAIIEPTPGLKFALKDALEKLQDNIDDSHFWDIESTDETMLMLLDIGFQVPHIAAMVNEDKLFVKAHLPANRT